MGNGVSRREPEVHVVVVQSQENGKMDAKVLRQTYASVRSSRKKRDETPSPSHKVKGNSPPSHERDSRPRGRLNHKVARSPPIPKRLSLPGPSHNRATNNADNSISHVLSTPNMTPENLTGRMYLDSPSDTHNHRGGYYSSSRFPPSRPRRSQNAHHGSSSHHVFSNYGASAMETMPEATYTGGEELSPVSEKGGNMFELFRTYDGEEYTVYVREDGKKFYVDFEEQKWRYFPSSWNERGHFLPIDYDPYHTPKGRSSHSQFLEGRAGEFIHPTRGKLITFLRQETQNVLYFFDEVTGSWMPMPLSWERHAPGVSGMISEIQSSCPGWKDGKSIVATLRQCNYSVDDCISTYHTISDDGVLDYSEGSGRDMIRTQMEKKLMESSSALKENEERNRELRTQIEVLQNRIEELDMENEGMKKELEIGKEEQRRKSKVYRQQSHGYSSRKVDVAVVQPLMKILGEDVRALRVKLMALRNSTVKGLRGFSTMLQQLSVALPRLLRTHRRQAQEIEEARSLYRREALQRKLLYNEIQELKGNIRVFCRCRYDSSGPCALRFEDEERVVCRTLQGRRKMFEFERVYSPDTTQEQVFEDTKPIITSCVDGYNVCLIAYGQTGGGKTYTMMGPPERPGVNIRSMKELFRICKERKKVKYTMKVSIVEVYNEAVYDLLVPPSEGHEKLQIQKRGKDVAVPGLTEIEVRSMSDVMMVLNEGEKNRMVACTKLNTNSSRSHLLLMLKVEGYDKVSKATSHGRLTLVDLAGSERISRSEATGIRLVEAAAINKSLSALGQIFASIRNGALHIPYRNSKLTYLLQPCIGGDSKACMFVNISPLEINMPETVSALDFGQNARQTELGKATKHVTKPAILL